MSIIITDENFEREIQRTDQMVLVDFYATWCEPCSLLTPILEKLEKEFKDMLVLLSANVDNTRLHAQKFQVDRIPMVVLFKNGWPISAFTGFKPESVIKEWLEKMIQDNMPPESSGDKQDTIEEMTKNFSEYAQKNGFQLNPDRKNVIRVINGLLENEKEKGKRYCPCRMLSGDQEEDSKKICPCIYHKEEIAKDGRCYCGLFAK
jgi:ferredoxin-thioredoxin reductase catalytic chain